MLLNQVAINIILLLKIKDFYNNKKIEIYYITTINGFIQGFKQCFYEDQSQW